MQKITFWGEEFTNRIFYDFNSSEVLLTGVLL